MKKSLFFAAALLALAACTREMAFDTSEGGMTLVAKMEGSAATRTVVEGGSHIFWEPGDEIAVFAEGESGKFTADLSATTATATFKGTLGKNDWTEGMDLWALYPYSNKAVFDGETITTVLPDKQVGRAGSFGKGMNPAIARSTSSTLQFYNIGGGLRFTLSQDGITEVVFEGLNGETLAGKVKVGFQDGKPAILDVTEGKTSITVTPPEGRTFRKDAWYYIVAIPGALENGFTFHFSKASDPSLVMPSSTYPKPVTIKRGIFGMLTYVDQGMNQTISDDIIAFEDPLVKSIVVKHFDTNGDGELSCHEAAVVLSFLVDETDTRATDGMVSIFAGTGITTFDELVYFTGLTRIEDGAFAGCTELTSIVIPETVEYIGADAFNGCTGLTSITLLSETPPAIGTDAFANTGDCPILVPEGAVYAYVAVWREYGYRIQPNEYPEPEVVDLGLPSGVKWASFNLGATKPEEYGDYFAWGETEPYYSNLDPLTWKEGKENGYYWLSYKWCQASTQKMNKYCLDPSVGYNGFADGKTVLDPEDDAASINLGGNWRMPTDAEWTELTENCTWTWTTRNGVNGRLVTGSNGKSIFLPVAGMRSGVYLYAAGTLGIYWSSSLYESDAHSARQIACNSDGFERGYSSRYYGYAVRPVYGDRIPVESVSLEQSELELYAGKTAYLRATVLPENAHDISILWSSSDESVATVYYNGIVMAVAPGTATVTVTTLDGGKTASCTVTVLPVQGTPDLEAIDLGLSVKWASFNLGATKPEEFGDYYAWGETEPKDDYSWSSYKWCMGSNDSMIKYSTVSSLGHNGFTDGKTVLDPEDDAASVNLGGDWRMPTYAEWVELLDNCTWTWVTQNGVNGRLVTGNNGNSIFLPAAGSWNNAKLYDAGFWGNYMSSSLYELISNRAKGVSFYSDGIMRSSNERYYGECVRPVYGNRVPVESVSLDPSELEIYAGNTAYLRVTVLPDNAHDLSILWSSSDESVATVSNGIMTAIAPGTATITVTTLDGGKTATCNVTVLSEPYTVAAPEAIDLGLSVKWASFNLGATKPEEYGDYFAWGETEPKDSYSWTSYKWCNGDPDQLTKYCPADGKTMLDPEDDAATVNLGGKWRMPTDSEWTELRDGCTWTWTTRNGVEGRLATGPNGNSIFIPAAGVRDGADLFNEGTYGHLWSSSLDTEDPDCAFNVYCNSVYVHRYGDRRCYGLSVRPVYDDAP